MFHDIHRRLAVALTSFGIFFAARGAAAADAPPAAPPVTFKYPDQADVTTAAAADDPSAAKLSSPLKLLVASDQKSRDPADAARRDAIRRLVGAPLEKTRGGADSIEVAIHVKPGTDEAKVAGDGIAIHFRQGDTLYASINVSELKRVSAEPQVISINPMLPREVPPAPKPQQQPAGIPQHAKSRDAAAPGAFDHQGLTGKGVIVGICDTGIDWRHPDFIRPDGTSRILYIYDIFDNSFNESDGKIGTAPPFVDTNKKPLGTVYTNEQINAALKGAGTVNSKDTVGHGTACAGTAAGNRSGDISGVAPEADIVFANVMPTGSYRNDVLYLGIRWVLDTAKKLNRPCALSLSMGGIGGLHDGSDEDEQLINEMVAAGKPGAAILVAAGNEGLSNIHASARFGPRRVGQADLVSPYVELFVHKETAVLFCFDHRDEWLLAIQGLDKFFVDEAGKPKWFYFYKNGTDYTGEWNKGMHEPADPQKWFQANTSANIGDKTDALRIVLSPGHYWLNGAGNGPNVPNGRFDIYLTDTDNATFGYGATHKGIIGSPGNASGAITVASYDFRDDWENADGKHIYYNLELGKISEYSSPGFRRDGVVKPDIGAPGQYTISSAAKDSEMSKTHGGNPNPLTKDGLHVAWAGTSAATPYCAGVVALMLQKNPTLDAAQIKKILVDTAFHNPDATGGVPNESWGYGRLDPEKALQNTPPPGNQK